MLTIKKMEVSRVIQKLIKVLIDEEISGDLRKNVLDAVMRKDDSRSTRFM